MTVVIVAAQVLKVLNSKVLEEVRFAGHLDNPGLAGDYSPVKDSFRLNTSLPADRMATALVHELAHASGHPKRLARSYIVGAFTGVKQPKFERLYGGQEVDPGYAQEELIAEMAAILVCQEAGVLTEESIAESSNYILVCAEKLSEKEFVHAAREAIRAKIFLVSGLDAKDVIGGDVHFESEFGEVFSQFVLGSRGRRGTSTAHGLGTLDTGSYQQGGIGGEASSGSCPGVVDSEVALEVTDVSDV